MATLPKSTNNNRNRTDSRNSVGNRQTVKKKQSANAHYSSSITSREEERRNHRMKRQRQQRMRRRIFFVILIFILVVVGIVLSLTVFFNISKCNVSGESIYTTEEIIAASGINTGDNLFLIDRTKARQNICEKLPFIGEVEFKNSFPSTLIITVKQTSIKCAVETGDGFILMNEDGKVLLKISSLDEINKEQSEEENYVLGNDNIIILRGLNVDSAIVGEKLHVKNEKAFKLYEEIMDSFEANDISGITSMDLSDILSIVITYQDRITIEVGSVSNLANKMMLAANVIKAQDEISPYQKGVINLTIDKQAYFTPASEEDSKSDIPDDKADNSKDNTKDNTNDNTNDNNANDDKTTGTKDNKTDGTTAGKAEGKTEPDISIN